MIWSIDSYCQCGRHKKLNKDTREKDVHCVCGSRFVPVVFNYDIEIAMTGGIDYILGELEYWKIYKPLEGLQQLTGIPLDDPNCTCDEVEEVCTHCIDKYAELSGD